jgi:hypothetical protein
MEPEYFFREAQRWSFGFQNPNKAAVVFACLLPLAWTAWAVSWQLRRRIFRVAAAMGSAVLFLGIGFCLLMTYSRGGVVAGAVALGAVCLMGWKKPFEDRPSRLQPVCSLMLIGVLVGMGVFLGVAERSAEALSSDASVGNRLVLWHSALVMAVENPAGFGAGNSGSAYMQWYQPPEMTAGYRTMVNSYLTFLVERGWVAAFLVLLAGLTFWLWARPDENGPVSARWIAALRAVILAFLVAAIFSSTMEDGRLWILPTLTAGTLAGWTMVGRKPITFRHAGLAGALALGVCLVFAAWGFVEGKRELLERRFEKTGDGPLVVTLRPRNIQQTGAGWTVLPDPAVLGTVYGKLVRRLCLEWGEPVRVGNPVGRPGEKYVVAGDQVGFLAGQGVARLVLLAPEGGDASSARRVLTANPDAVLFLPEIDEDGRSAFWEEAARTAGTARVIPLEGVGVQVDWAWETFLREAR